MESEANQKYERAKKRVEKIKGFHAHLRTFVIINVLIFIIRFFVLPKVPGIPTDEGFVNWLNWNTYLMPLLWGVGLGMHALFVFGEKVSPFKQWEERKINEILNKENESEEKM